MRPTRVVRRRRARSKCGELVVLCAVRPVGPFRRFARIRDRVSQSLLSYGLPTTCEVTRPVLRFANSHRDRATGRFFRTNDPMAVW